MKNREIASAFMTAHGQSAESIDAASALKKLHTEIDRGLSGNGGLPMLPAYIRPEHLPQQPPDSIAVDIGGSTLRRAAVHWTPAGEPCLTDVRECSLSQFGFSMDEETFFRRIVEFSGIRGSGLPLAVSYSYNMESLPGPDARMLGWCKELTVSGMTGATVAQAIRRAAGEESLSVSVINDSVASMLGCEKAAGIGIIVGTGFNICTTLPAEAFAKLPAGHEGDMLVNTEVGESRAFPMGDFDREIILKSEDPASAQAEKQVSGRYLEQLLQLALKQAQKEKLLDAGFACDLTLPQMGDILKAQPESLAACILSQGVERSAIIAAISLHAFRSRMRGNSPIATEGSVLRKLPGFAGAVSKKLAELSGNTPEFTRGSFVGLIGAARTVRRIL